MMRLAHLLSALCLTLVLVASPSLGSVAVFGFKVPIQTAASPKISYDGDSGKLAPGSTTFTFTSGTLGVAPIANRYVIASIITGGVSISLSSVTICGNTATRAVTVSPTSNFPIFIYAGLCATGSTAAIAVTTSASMSNAFFAVYSTTLGSAVADHTSTSTASPSPTSVAVSSAGVAVSFDVSLTSATSIAISGSQTQNYNGQFIGSTSMAAGADQSLPSGGTSTATYTYVGGSAFGAIAASFH